MNKVFIFFCLIIFFPLFGQEHSSNQSTSFCGGRWEIFMSEVGAKISFKFDKYTGDIYQMVRAEDNSLIWQPMKKEESSKDIQKTDIINYQLFSSGLGIKYTFILNTNSGLVWQLVSNYDEILSFQIMK